MHAKHARCALVSRVLWPSTVCACIVCAVCLALSRPGPGEPLHALRIHRLFSTRSGRVGWGCSTLFGTA
eukprot:2104095-Rhodomonas_salina.1